MDNQYRSPMFILLEVDLVMWVCYLIFYWSFMPVIWGFCILGETNETSYWDCCTFEGSETKQKERRTKQFDDLKEQINKLYVEVFGYGHIVHKMNSLDVEEQDIFIIIIETYYYIKRLFLKMNIVRTLFSTPSISFCLIV